MCTEVLVIFDQLYKLQSQLFTLQKDRLSSYFLYVPRTMASVWQEVLSEEQFRHLWAFCIWVIFCLRVQRLHIHPSPSVLARGESVKISVWYGFAERPLMHDHIEWRGRKQNVVNDVAEVWLNLSWILDCLVSFLNSILLFFASYIKNPHFSCACFLLRRLREELCVMPKAILVFGISFQDVLKVV